MLDQADKLGCRAFIAPQVKQGEEEKGKRKRKIKTYKEEKIIRQKIRTDKLGCRAFIAPQVKQGEEEKEKERER